MLISEFEINDKPRERAKSLGFSSLTTIELVALIIRSGAKEKSALEVAANIVADCSNISKLRNYSVNQLNKVYGMGDAKSTSLLAALELANRYKKQSKNKEVVCINNPKSVYNVLSNYQFNTKQEEFYIICLNRRREVISSKMLFRGTIDSSLVHPREIFTFALECSSSFVIFAHNHPSGNLTPSIEDVEVTEKLVECGEILGIKVLDHLVFSDEDFLSMKEKCYM